MTYDTDILVAGGGLAGLMATLLFAKAGFTTICVDPAPPPQDDAAPGDLRSTAFLMPSVDLLAEAGALDAVQDIAGDLRVMRLADAGGPEMAIREVVDFRAEEIGQERFGWNFPDAPLRAALMAVLADEPLAELRHGCRAGRVTTRMDHALVRLSDGSRVRARLVVAADGRDSALREAAGIEVRRQSYGQKALVFMVSHPVPHEAISTEIHRTGGPFTLVPLAGEDQKRSAIVWMETGAEAARLASLDDAAFAAAATARSCGVLGPLSLISDKAVWPIISQEATRLTDDRLALVAEAAHVIPPIGAQGLNMSLADIACLRDLAVATPESLGSAAMLDQYARQRRPDITMRVRGVDALNRAAMAEAQSLRDLRQMGLRLIGGTAAKTPLMRMGLGAR